MDPACCGVARNKDRENERTSTKAVNRLIDGGEPKGVWPAERKESCFTIYMFGVGPFIRTDCFVTFISFKLYNF